MTLAMDVRQENALRRLRAIEGQVKGLQKMVGEDRPCVEILTQLSAVQEALRKVSKVIMRRYLETCATKAIRGGEAQQVYDDLMDLIFRYAR